MPRNNPGYDMRSTGADGRVVWMQFELTAEDRRPAVEARDDGRWRR